MSLRRAALEDAPAIAEVHLTAMRVSLPFLPQLHTSEEGRRYFSEFVLPAYEVWASEADGQVVAYVAFDSAWVHHLYVLPDWQGRGLGRALLERALADGLPKQLWTFQRNTRARAMYEARGFVAVHFTDGFANEEAEPDVLYRWPGRLASAAERRT